MKCDELITNIAKYMDESILTEYSELDKFYELKKLIQNDLAKALDDGFYTDSSSVIARINDYCAGVQHIECNPFFSGKKIINVFAKVNDLKRKWSGLLYLPDNLMENQAIPMILVGNTEVEDVRITAVNYTDQPINLTVDEYLALIRDVKEAKIEYRRLVKYFIVESSRYFENLCLGIWPDEMIDHDDLCRHFVDRAVQNIMVAGTVIRARQRLYALKGIPVDIFCDAKEQDKVQNILSEDQKKQIKFYDNDTLEKRFEAVNAVSSPISLENAIDDILLDVNIFYEKNIQHLADIKRMLKNDSGRLPKGEVKEKIENYISTVEKRIAEYEDKLQEYKEVYQNILQIACQLQNILNGRGEEQNALKTRYFDRHLESIFFKYLAINDFNRGEECFWCMKDSQYHHADILKSYIKYKKGEALSRSEWVEIADCKNVDNGLRLEEEYLKTIISLIPELRYPKEYYFYGKRLVDEQQYLKAADYLKKALAGGYADAGKELLELSLKHPECDITKQQLADMLIPDANSFVGMEELEEGDKDRAVVNLKIAAAKGNLDAIAILAKWLFEICKDISEDDMKEEDSQEKVGTVIGLYDYLNRQNDGSNYNEQIGLMYCKLKDYRRALAYLKDMDTPEAAYQCALMYVHGDGTAVDLQKALEYCNKAGDYAQDLKEKIETKLAKEQKSNYYQEDFSSNVEISSSDPERSGFCFITTAACLALHERKDCQQLNILREFRDTYISDGGTGDLLIDEYYRVGPLLVSKIERGWNPMAVYYILWEFYIEPSCEAIKQHKRETAKNIYITMVKNLCRHYRVPLREEVVACYHLF